MLVIEMCKEPFTISKNYNYEVVCDVIDMDVCRFILGHPWKFEEVVLMPT